MKLRRFLTVSSILLFSACGEQLPLSERGANADLERLVGSLRVLDATDSISSEEARVIQTVCADLRRKESLFNDFADTGTKLRYTSETRTCGTSESTISEPYLVGIGISNNRFMYQPENVQPPFSYVVTHNEDIMGTVCQHVQNSLAQGATPRRVILTGGDPVWVSAFASGSSRCAMTPEANCVFVETGLKVSGSTRYRVRDAKFFAVNSDLSDATRGFVSKRSQVNLCAGTEEQTYLRAMNFIGTQN